jgi:hypothetical protein
MYAYLLQILQILILNWGHHDRIVVGFNDLRLEVSKPPFHTLEIRIGLVWFMVFNSTFNNISAILWRSVLLVEEPGGYHRPVVSH